jgi:hypothetical protein
MGPRPRALMRGEASPLGSGYAGAAHAMAAARAPAPRGKGVMHPAGSRRLARRPGAATPSAGAMHRALRARSGVS